MQNACVAPLWTFIHVKYCFSKEGWSTFLMETHSNIPFWSQSVPNLATYGWVAIPITNKEKNSKGTGLNSQVLVLTLNKLLYINRGFSHEYKSLHFRAYLVTQVLKWYFTCLMTYTSSNRNVSHVLTNGFIFCHKLLGIKWIEILEVLRTKSMIRGCSISFESHHRIFLTAISSELLFSLSNNKWLCW